MHSCMTRWGIEAFNTQGVVGTHHMWMVCSWGEIQECCQDGACWWPHQYQHFNFPSGWSIHNTCACLWCLVGISSIGDCFLNMGKVYPIFSDIQSIGNYWKWICGCLWFHSSCGWLMIFRTEMCALMHVEWAFVIRHVQYAARDMVPAFTVLTRIVEPHFIPCVDSELAITWRHDQHTLTWIFKAAFMFVMTQ